MEAEEDKPVAGEDKPIGCPRSDREGHCWVHKALRDLEGTGMHPGWGTVVVGIGPASSDTSWAVLGPSYRLAAGNLVGAVAVGNYP